MAAPGWKSHLPQNSIFSDLGASAASSRSAPTLKNILNVYDNILYVWDDANACVQTLNLLSLSEVDEKKTPCQSQKTLLCTDPPLFPVRELHITQSGCHLALVGDRGITVLELPRVWTRRQGASGGNKPPSVLCKSTRLGERRLGRSSVRILHAAWHPGCETESLIVVLTSDGKLSFYDLCEPSEPVEEVSLSEESGPAGVADCPSVYELALGEIPVSFDFGQPVVLDKKRGGEIGFPIYVLWGNGNVHMVVTGITTQRLASPLVLGPLRMQPPAEDNYGVDACSIICLKTQPQVLVVSTCTGILYHCVLLDGGNKTSKHESPSTSLSEPVMYVYESVELELSLTTVDVQDDSRLEDDFTCHIKLHTDPASPMRYHCTHSAGLHSVVLPWMKQMETFVQSQSPEPLDPSEQAVIEHLVCTKPLPSSSPAPVQGLSIVTEAGLGTSLICLTCDFQCTVLPMRCRCKTDPAPLVSRTSLSASSPHSAVRKEPFKKHIQQILARSSSNPILKAGKPELTPEECYQLLTRATQVFREEYIHKQHLAKAEIDKRVRLLSHQKQAQLSSLESCEESRILLQESAECLADRFDHMEQNQRHVFDRVESVLHRLQSRLPVLSDAEKGMGRDLEDMHVQLEKMDNQLEQIKSKRKFQPKLDRLSSPRTQPQSPQSAVTTTQINKLKSLLKDEGDVISENMRRLKLVKSQLGV